MYILIIILCVYQLGVKSWSHDFMITENYILLIESSVIFDIRGEPYIPIFYHIFPNSMNAPNAPYIFYAILILSML